VSSGTVLEISKNLKLMYIILADCTSPYHSDGPFVAANGQKHPGLQPYPDPQGLDGAGTEAHTGKSLSYKPKITSKLGFDEKLYGACLRVSGFYVYRFL
jgi:hypothetical protein